jgi:hypothetical protein
LGDPTVSRHRQDEVPKVGYILEMDGDLEKATADMAMFKKIYATFRPT